MSRDHRCKRRYSKNQRERDNVRNSIGNGSITGHSGNQTALHNIQTHRIDTSVGSWLNASLFPTPSPLPPLNL